MSFMKQAVKGFPSPKTIASEWRVVSSEDGVSPESQIQNISRMVAEQGRNGLYSVKEQTHLHDAWGNGASSKYNPGGTVHVLLSKTFGRPDGKFTQEEAVQALEKFEQENTQKPRIAPARAAIPHYTIGQPS